jgi:L-2,4-diaminobutyrate decarboxylase
VEPLDHPVLSAIEEDADRAAGEAFAELVAGYFDEARSGAGRVSTARAPEELARRFDEPLPVSGRPLADVLARLRGEVVPDSNHLCHPRAMGHQVSPPLPAAVWTESLIGALNQSTAVWEMSPAGTILEARVVRWMCDLAGFGPAAGGNFTSGGTEATFTALLAARAAACPNAWTEGLGDRPPIVLHGEHAHYAVSRAVGELGLGTDNAIAVASRGFRMDPVALEAELDRARARERRVMAVVATAGTTATGSFDDLEAVGRICEDRGAWLHVDGAHGASALFSPAHRHRVRGLEKARSVAWDPHKMMLMPLAASVVLVRDERDLDAAFSQRAPYLFHRGEGGGAGIAACGASSARAGSTPSRYGSRSNATGPKGWAPSTTGSAPPPARSTTRFPAAPISSRSTSPSRTSSASATGPRVLSTTSGWIV